MPLEFELILHHGFASLISGDRVTMLPEPHALTYDASTHLPLSAWTMLLVAIVICLARPVEAQTLPIPTGISEAEVVANAEAEGAAFSRLTPPATLGRNFTTVANGTAERKCVEGPPSGAIRSGDFAIAGEVSVTHALKAGRPGKISWAPLHHSREMNLLVRGRNLTNSTDTVRFTSSHVAWPVTRGAPPTPEAEREYFFPSVVSMRGSGRWLLVATSGANWGCFIITVK